MTVHKRLFFALWPDDALRQALSEVAGRLPDTGGRKVAPENYHMTLLFLGNVPATQLTALRNGAATLERHAFDLCLDEGGWWRGPGIWRLTPSATPPALNALAEALARMAQGLGLEVRRREFRPHVTLMRKLRTAAPAPAFAPLHWRAGDFLLLESLTLPEGAQYLELGRWPLRP